MRSRDDKYDFVIVGGGFFGLNIAEYFARKGRSVLLCERADACMTRASYVNQARIHNGYHYPRSILTAMRSRMSFPRFVKEFEPCVVGDFDKYYAIGKILGKITSLQFVTFCKRIGAFCEEASSDVRRLFSPYYIEQVFKTQEFAFDSSVLCRLMLHRVQEAGVEVVLRAEVGKVVSDGRGRLLVSVRDFDGGEFSVLADNVFNCTYANINSLNAGNAQGQIPLKYEMTEMALVEPPEEIDGRGFTIMCGPFFSIMPFPPKGLYSLSHVRYTPHYEWHDPSARYVSPLSVFERDPKESFYTEMIHDAGRYLPCIAKSVYRESIWEVKTVLPSSEVDDSRPILFKINYGMKGYHCVMGGKIDNIYDVLAAIELHKEEFK